MLKEMKQKWKQIDNKKTALAAKLPELWLTFFLSSDKTIPLQTKDLEPCRAILVGKYIHDWSKERCTDHRLASELMVNSWPIVFVSFFFEKIEHIYWVVSHKLTHISTSNLISAYTSFYTFNFNRDFWANLHIDTTQFRRCHTITIH